MKEKPRKELIGNEGMVLLDTVRRLVRRNAVDNLLKMCNKTHPADMAWVFRHLAVNDRKFVFNIVAQTEMVGEFLSELDQSIMLDVVADLTPQFLMTIINDMPSDDAADIMEALPEEQADEVRRLMAREDREEVDELLQYQTDTAGGLMSTDFMALDENMSVADAIKKIQDRSGEMEMVFYLYITHGEEGRLAGVLSLRELLMHPPYRQLRNIMNPSVVSVDVDTDQGEVAHVVSQYNFLAVPVVDSTYRLAGIVTVDDVIDVIREEATEEFLQMAGAGKDREILLKPVLKNAMLRAPWLFATWFGGLLNIFIISSFETELEKAIALAAFIPIIAGMGGSIANQSSTIIVRGIATGRINIQETAKLVFKELRVGLILGIFFGGLLGLLYFAGHHEMASLAQAITISSVCSMTIAATIGTIVPVTLRRIGVDAAIATVPFVSTSMDIISVTTYFFIAKFMLGL